jgi:hypothetical protein
MLKEAGVLEDMNIPCSRDALEKPITRYEMAVLIRNVLYNVYCENTMELTNPAANISDYNSIDMAYRGSVEQAYGKGILTGYSDSSFQGGRNLSRAEAAAVICRLLWAVRESRFPLPRRRCRPPSPPNPLPSVTAACRRPNAVSPCSAMRTRPTLPAPPTPAATSWACSENLDLKSDGVTKYTRTWTIYVNTVVVEEVKAIFEEIYNNPEKSPSTVSAARGIRTPCAIPGAAPSTKTRSKTTMSITRPALSSEASATRTAAVPTALPRAAAWYRPLPNTAGVGRQGWTSAVDYMHFSILSSGG